SELHASVVGLGRWREHFDDQRRIEEHVAVLVQKLWLAANDGHIRIGEESCADADFHDARRALTGPVLQLRAELLNELPNPAVVDERDSRHGEHLPLEIFALDLGLALDLEILFRSEMSLRQRGHGQPQNQLTMPTPP